MKCTAIVLAAGQGKRMNSKVQKQYLLIKEDTNINKINKKTKTT